jgi:restriction system protein
MIAMARSFLSNVVRISREMERAERTRLREAERQQRAMEKEARRRDRSERESYAASREAEAQSENKVLASQIQALKQLLSSRVGQDPSIDFKSLFRVPDERELNNDETLRLPEKPALSSYLPKLPNIFVRWIPGVSGSYRRKRDKAAAVFGGAQAAYNEILRKRSETFSQLKRRANDQNNAVIEFARHYTAGEPKAVATYCELVLTKSSYPDGFPLERRVVFLSESKQLVIEFELPTLSDIIPTTEKFRYVKKSHEIVGTALSEKVRHAIYSNVIA